MEDENQIKELKISKFRMFMKFGKTLLSIIFRKDWFIPGVSEISVDELKNQLYSDEMPIIIDTRNRDEFYATEKAQSKSGHIQHSMSIPIWQLPANLKNLAEYKDQEIVTICPGGGMSLTAAEIMVEAGFTNVRSMKGGMFKWDKEGYPTTTELDPTYPLDEFKTPKSKDKSNKGDKYSDEVHKTVDARNFSCPIPILKSKKAIDRLDINQVLEILTTDPGSKTDIPAWVHVTSHELVSKEEINSEEFRFIVKKLK